MYCTRCDFDLDVAKRIIKYESSCEHTVCSCIISAPPEHHIRLELSLFRLADFYSRESFKIMLLVQDWFYVFDGNSTSHTLLWNFTGTQRPFTIQSSGRFMMIQLERDRWSRSFFKGSYNYSKTKGKLMFIFVYVPYISRHG